MDAFPRGTRIRRRQVRPVIKPIICFQIAATIVAMAFPAQTTVNSAPRPLHSSQVKAQPVDQEELLWWLPADTESVVVAKGPFPLPLGPSKDEEESDQDWFTKKATQVEIHAAFEQLPLELFYALELGTPLRGTIVAFAMQGSRHFRDPLPGLEVMDFEGCSVVVFENNSSSLVDSLLRKLAKKASRTENVASTRVLIFPEKLGEAKWSLYVAAPRPNLLLVANNLSYLQEVLQRMGQHKSPRALPDQLPEWRFLNQAVRFWGLRHYDPTQAKEDATSPFHAGSNEHPAAPFTEDKTFSSGDQKAIGILFTLDPTKPRQAVITYFSGDESKVKSAASAGTTVANPQEGVSYEIKIRNPMPGVLEYVHTLDQVSTLDYFVLTVTVALGRGMYF